MELIPITDSRTMTYMNYRGIRPHSSKREGRQVTAFYENNEEFQQTKMDMMIDKTFYEVLNAKHNTEELLRTTI